MRKLLPIFSFLSFIIGVCSLVTYADWKPTEFINSKCINVTELEKTEGIITLGQKGEVVCGRHKCTVDVVQYGSLDNYIDELGKRFQFLVNQKFEVGFIDKIKNFFDSDSLIKLRIRLEKNVKLNNIKLVLNDIVKDIENKKFIKANFLLVSTSYDPNEPDAIAQFVNSDSIVGDNNYDETYFNKIKNEKVLPLLNSVETYLNNIE